MRLNAQTSLTRWEGERMNYEWTLETLCGCSMGAQSARRALSDIQPGVDGVRRREADPSWPFQNKVHRGHLRSRPASPLCALWSIHYREARVRQIFSMIALGCAPLFAPPDSVCFRPMSAGSWHSIGTFVSLRMRFSSADLTNLNSGAIIVSMIDAARRLANLVELGVGVHSAFGATDA